jgi:serine/threonine protein kinase
MSSFLSDSDSTRKIELISQGTYGCIFKPGMNCKGEIEKEGYITKLQYDPETTENEVDIGKTLLEKDENNKKKNKEYNNRFAPILHSCPISLGIIKDDFIEKCKVIKDNALSNTFYSNQIRYVGKYTLADYFSMLRQEPDKRKFIRFCSRYHIYLLESLILLNDKKIVHFDLKENNILIDQKRNIPVIIDFGLSIHMNILLETPLNSDKYIEKFFTYYDKYPPWCLEIILISFMVKNVHVDSIWGGRKNTRGKPKTIKDMDSTSTFEWTSRIVKKEDLLLIIDHYFKESPIIKAISLDKTENYKKKWVDWIQQIYTDKKSAMYGKFMVNKLIESWTSWDTFSLSVLFFIILQKFLPNHYLDYQDILIENILDIPTERKTPEILKKELSVYFRSIQKKSS